MLSVYLLMLREFVSLFSVHNILLLKVVFNQAWLIIKNFNFRSIKQTDLEVFFEKYLCLYYMCQTHLFLLEHYIDSLDKYKISFIDGFLILPTS